MGRFGRCAHNLGQVGDLTYDQPLVLVTGRRDVFLNVTAAWVGRGPHFVVGSARDCTRSLLLLVIGRTVCAYGSVAGALGTVRTERVRSQT